MTFEYARMYTHTVLCMECCCHLTMVEDFHLDGDIEIDNLDVKILEWPMCHVKWKDGINVIQLLYHVGSDFSYCAGTWIASFARFANTLLTVDLQMNRWHSASKKNVQIIARYKKCWGQSQYSGNVQNRMHVENIAHTVPLFERMRHERWDSVTIGDKAIQITISVERFIVTTLIHPFTTCNNTQNDVSMKIRE